MGHPLPKGEGYSFCTTPGVQPKTWDTLSPLGERVARDGVFISRRGTGEGVSIFMTVVHAPLR